ncbi:site-specific DNA-methyltransferase [Methylocystis sp. Sn-Cys]|uniref:DNA-methyltransferase n=1 Tax=Methylocystis sp. Sn-Cys TaxID=1701263 RepID=UPI001924F8E7|nr:site-specific DNA-methyltransferase [Methylocystis sp. Sn-Cys]MBL1256650.1 site-specific DNA-methyltransferase [Methylocystis sp. Sn-Cys]
MLQVLDRTRDRVSKNAPQSWTVGKQKVVLGDCETLLAGIPAGSVDVVVTSPPYNIGVTYRSYDDRKPRQAYLQWLGRIAVEISRVLKHDGSLFLNVGSTNSDPWVAMDVANVFREHFTMQNNFTWVKSISIGNDSVGHFKPISGKRFLNHNHESVFHFTKSGCVELDRLAIGVPFKDKTNIARWGHERDKRCGGNVWFIPYRTVRSKSQKFGHPAGFPVELPERCIRLHGRQNPVVLDPFLGAGSTLAAAQKLGCDGIGIEIDPVYAQTSVDRLRSA